jgi:hypothetical protein
MKREWSRKGQFYLLAAIIIVALIMGLAISTNNAKQQGINKSEIYKLFAKINIDNDKLINYNSATTGYLTIDLENIFSEFVKAYPTIKEVYVILNKDNAKSYYIYDNTGLKVLNDDDLKSEFAGYYEGSNFYALIIKEKNGEQYTVISNA